MIKICHLTSVHQRNDTRIFIKECTSLASAGYDVSLVVADGRGDATVNSVKIFDVGKPGGRLSRILFKARDVYRKGLELDCTVYHLHDPELIPWGIKLLNAGKKVIFDSHEDISRQILGKHYMNNFFKKIASLLYGRYERYTCARFDYIITATPFIRDLFSKFSRNCVDVNNYPLLNELSILPADGIKKKKEICYVGGITEIRGIRNMVRALESLDDVRLNLAGEFSDQRLRDEVAEYPGWKQVNELGFQNREEVKMIFGRSLAGLVVLLPAENYVVSLPVKMFEYMNASLPVIASDFPLWKEIIEGNECGFCADPLDSDAIAGAIRTVIDNQDIALRMGANGKRAVKDKYNWEAEEKKLLSVYEKVAG